MKRSWDNKRVIAFFAGNDRAKGGMAGKLGVERALFLDNWGVVRDFSLFRYWLTPILFSGYVNLIKAMQYLFQMLLFRIVGLFNLKSFTNSIRLLEYPKRKRVPPRFASTARIYLSSKKHASIVYQGRNLIRGNF